MIIEFYNEAHLGDSVFHLNFLRKLTHLTDDHFIYYVTNSYLAELSKHIIGYENRIQLCSLSQRTPAAINAWIGEIYYQHSNKFIYDKFYVDWFNYLTNKIYGNSMHIDMFSDYLPLSEQVNGYNILIINSIPLSGQFDYNQDMFDKTIKELNKKHNIITTKKVEGIRCTMDHNMSLVDIGRIASNSKNIVAIHTGALSCCINKWAIDRVNSWIIGDKNNLFSFNNLQLARTANDFDSMIRKSYLND